MPLHNAGSQQRQPGRDVPHPANLLHVPAVSGGRRRRPGRRAGAADRQRRAGHGQRRPSIDDAAELRDVHTGAGSRPRTADRGADAGLRSGVDSYACRGEDGDDERNVLEGHRFPA